MSGTSPESRTCFSTVTFTSKKKKKNGVFFCFVFFHREVAVVRLTHRSVGLQAACGSNCVGHDHTGNSVIGDSSAIFPP